MTMPYSPSRAVYEGNNAATSFPFFFRVWTASQLVVTLTSPEGVTSEAAGWTADLGAAGGEITYLHQNAPLPNGWKLAITRNMPFTQEVNLVSASRFDPQVIEDALDQATAERQQTLEMMRRSVILPATSSETPQDVVQNIFAARDHSQAARNAAQAAMNTAGQSAAAAAENAARAFSQADRAKTEADRAQNLANIGPATQEKFGMVKIGEGIAVEDDGTISVPPPPKISLATTASAGTVIIGEGLEIAGASSGEDAQAQPNPGTVSLGGHASEDGEKYGRGNFQFFGHVRLTDDFEETASASEGIGLSPAGAKAMYDKLLGLKGTTTITSSRDFVAPEAATYRVTVVGGGGSGGSGGTAYDWSEYVNDAYWSYTAYSGGGGGGGGAGETLVRDVTLAKGESVPVIVGGPGGNSSFGSHAVARGGGRGGNGGSGSRGSGIPNGGGGGTSYGSGAGSGGRGSWDNNETPSITGGSGGAGGRSTHGQYGHGGNGGPGGGYSSGRRTSPSGGVSGTQGVVIVTLNLGG
uniref:Uncharacterized protein n=1 Tax=Desulfovibrio desulfuricans (strain ATCC 27774 / DSM 6949 / MB) TaxID=525146 RepID=B8IYP2_DESDA